MSGLIIFLPREPWATVVSIVLLFPLLLWLAARCQPVFSAAAAFIVALTIVWTTTFGIGIFGELEFPDYRTSPCGSGRHPGRIALLTRSRCAVFRTATAPGCAQRERGADAGTEAPLRNCPDRPCVSHSRLPLSADQPAFDGNLRNFSRRSYWPHGARHGPASCRTSRKYRSDDFADRRVDHGHRSQRSAAGRRKRGARMDHQLACRSRPKMATSSASTSWPRKSPSVNARRRPLPPARPGSASSPTT